MTYVVSNLHGHLEEFQALLQAIRFNADRDIMYVLGDIVDIGPDPMGLVRDLSVRLNVYPIAGECDFRAVKMLTGYEKMQDAMAKGESPDADFVSELTDWIQEGGEPTLSGYRALDKDMQEGVLDYLSDMPLYEEITVNGKDYFLLHQGIYDYVQGMDFDWLEVDDFFTDTVDPTLPYFESKTVLVGHIPTGELGNKSHSIHRGNGSVFVDCGLGRGGRLGCLCLESGEEFYV